MKFSKFALSILGVLFTAATAMANFTGFVPVRPNFSLYVDFIEPQQGQPTVVLLNGVTYTTVEFESFARALAQRGLGVLRLDFRGMGKTLLKYDTANSVYPMDKPYPYDEQAMDLKAVLVAMKIPLPYNIVGLSYGGGIGIDFVLHFPRDVQNLVAISPYTEPLQQQDQWCKQMVAASRLANPFNPATDQELYDFFFHNLVLTTYPAAEPSVMDNPYMLEAVYNLARGIRAFRPVDFAEKIPPGVLHLMIAQNDQYIPNAILDKFWNKLNPGRQSRVLVQMSEHKITQEYPQFTAAWVNEIIRGNPALHKGISFVANPTTMTATGGGQTIPLGK